MQISNSDQLITKKETNREEYHLSDQLQRKATIAKRITAFLNSSNTEV